MQIPKVGLISLGCPKATVDSERIVTQLRAAGYLIVPTYSDADLVVVNTCGFTAPAGDKYVDAIGVARRANAAASTPGSML